MVKNARTIFIMSKMAFVTVDTLDRALGMQKEWPKLELTIVQEQRDADLVVEMDRPLFTCVHTFVVSDERTSIVLEVGKVTAFDITIASGGIAKELVQFLTAARLPGVETKR